MGRAGKDRTKFQPSSSLQAFSQVQQTGFVGFSSGRLPGTAVEELSGQLQLTFKKAAKKDATTKIKAFSELQELFLTPEVDQNIDTCLDLWCNIFKGLLLDRERKAREMGLKAHGAIMQVAGRRIAPYLKRLCGPWLLFLHDSNRATRSFASKAFFSSFPEKKHVETWIYCKSELLSFLTDRLDQPKLVLCPPSLAKGAEATEIYEENMAQSLLALGFLLRTLPREETDKSLTKYETIISNSSFWKLMQEGTLVQCAFLSFLAHSIGLLPRMGEHKEKIFSFFVDVLQRKDKGACQLVWKPLITFTREWPEQFSLLPAKLLRQFEANLFSFLREGACGSGIIAYPSLAPLAGILPPAILHLHKGDEGKFFEMLLQSLWKGSECKGALVELVASYIDIFLLMLERVHLISQSASMDSQTTPTWTALILKPLREVLSSEAWTEEVSKPVSIQFARVFSETSRGSHDQPSLFKLFSDLVVECLQISMETQSQSSARKIASFVSAASNIHNSGVDLQQKELIEKVIGFVSQNAAHPSSLELLAELIQQIPVTQLLPEGVSLIQYFNQSLSPAITVVFEDRSTTPTTLTATLVVIEQILKHFEGKKDALNHTHVWRLSLEALQKASNISALLTFLKFNINPETPSSQRTCAALDQIVLEVIDTQQTECSLESKFHFLTFAMGGMTMTSQGSLVSPSARLQAVSKLADLCLAYQDEKVQHIIPFHRVQEVAFSIKLLSDCISSNLLPRKGDASLIRKRCLRAFFILSADIKYFWSQMEIDLASFKVTSNNVHAETESYLDFLHFNGHSDELKRSPIALAACHAWNMNAPSLSTFLPKVERLEFVHELISDVHQEIRRVDSPWFRPALHTQQIGLLVDLVEHSATQFVLDAAILSESQWKEMRGTVGNDIDRLVDYHKLSLSFFTTETVTGSSSSPEGRSTFYSRMLTFLVCLMKELSVEVVIGKSDYRRIWTLQEVYSGYVLCKDLAPPTIDHANVLEEEWAQVGEYLLEFLNKQVLVSSEELTSPFLKALVRSCLNRLTATDRDLLEAYTSGYIIRRCINGNHLRSAQFLELYEPQLSQELKPGVSSVDGKDLWYYQAVLPEVLGNLKSNQLEALGLFQLYQELVESTMGQQGTVLVSETLLHFLGAEGILDRDRAEVMVSLLIFFSEWEGQSLPIVREAGSRVELIRLILAIFEHPLTQGPASQFSDFAASFAVSSVSPSAWTSSERAADQTLLFHSLKLAKAIGKRLSPPLSQAAKAMCEWEISLLTRISMEGSYSPSRDSLFQALSQAILALPEEAFSIGQDSQKRMLHIIQLPHSGLQKAAFAILRGSIMQAPALSLPESSETGKGLSDMIPVELSALIANASQNWMTKDALEMEDVGYQYRSSIVEMVAWCWGWLLLCRFYSKQNGAERRLLSTALRSFIPQWMGFLFRYLELRTPRCVPNLEVDLAGFNPAFTESLDQFVCDAYLTTLRTFPALVREWWCDDCNRAFTQYVESYTTKLFSPVLIKREIDVVHGFEHDFDDFEVNANSQLMQVQAFYEKDDVKLGITLTIPDAYPLRDIIVTSERLGISEAQRRQLILSMHVLLHSQDATVLDAVLLWKGGMEKRFEGVETCVICYSIFQDAKTPQLKCKTCKNKFHAACLHKWFTTSHKSNCPLCQTPWMA